MSIVAPSQRRLVWPVAIALTCSMVVALLLYLPTRTTPTSDPVGSVAAPGVAQADWELKVFPAGVAGSKGLTKKVKARIAAQRTPLNALVTEVYDALFLEPGRAEAVIRDRFSRDAGRALGSKIGLPKGADDVQIKRRIARVGIHVQGATRAAARVTVTGLATVKNRKVRFEHSASLWLERSHRAWKVIGYDVIQGPKR